MIFQQEHNLYNIPLLNSIPKIANRVKTSVHNLATNHTRLATIGNYASGFVPIYSDYQLVKDVKDSKKWVGCYLILSALKYTAPVLVVLSLPPPLGEIIGSYAYAGLGVRDGHIINRIKEENQNLTESNPK